MTNEDIYEALRRSWRLILRTTVNAQTHANVQKAADVADRTCGRETIDWYTTALNSYLKP